MRLHDNWTIGIYPAARSARAQKMSGRSERARGRRRGRDEDTGEPAKKRTRSKAANTKCVMCLYDFGTLWNLNRHIPSCMKNPKGLKNLHRYLCDSDTGSIPSSVSDGTARYQLPDLSFADRYPPNPADDTHSSVTNNDVQLPPHAQRIAADAGSRVKPSAGKRKLTATELQALLIADDDGSYECDVDSDLNDEWKGCAAVPVDDTVTETVSAAIIDFERGISDDNDGSPPFIIENINSDDDRANPLDINADIVLAAAPGVRRYDVVAACAAAAAAADDEETSSSRKWLSRTLILFLFAIAQKYNMSNAVFGHILKFLKNWLHHAGSILKCAPVVQLAKCIPVSLHNAAQINDLNDTYELDSYREYVVCGATDCNAIYIKDPNPKTRQLYCNKLLHKDHLALKQSRHVRRPEAIPPNCCYTALYEKRAMFRRSDRECSDDPVKITNEDTHLVPIHRYFYWPLQSAFQVSA